MLESNELNEQEVSSEEAEEALEKGYDEAKIILEDTDKLEEFFLKLERKLQVFPVGGKALSNIPVMASMVRSYTKKEYSEVPVGTITAIISALVYFISPIDMIPDIIPGVGYIDDAAVIAVCLKFIKSDLDDYSKWREENVKTI